MKPLKQSWNSSGSRKWLSYYSVASYQATYTDVTEIEIKCT